MIVQLAKTVLVWLIAICVVGFILFHFFTDPVGSAHVVSSIAGGIKNGIEAIITFVKAL